jgi:hypothetical protein
VGVASHTQRARFTLVAEHRTRVEPQPRGLQEELRRRGHHVRSLDARSAFDAGDDSWVRSSDLVIARGASAEILSLLRCAEVSGVPVLHTASALAAVCDRSRVLARLDAAGIPVALPVPDGRTEVLPARPMRPTEPVRDEVRVDVIGTAMFGHSVPSGCPAERLPSLPPGLADLVRRCVDLLRLRLLGTRWSASQAPTLIDVEAFPCYSDVPGASALLATEVEGALREARATS